MEREGSLPLSQELSIAPHPETNELGPYFKTRTLKSILKLFVSCPEVDTTPK